MKEMLWSYERNQQGKYIFLAENETYNEQWRAYSIKLLQNNEKLKGKRKKPVVGIKRLQKLVRNWRVEACKHLSHINMLKTKLKS